MNRFYSLGLLCSIAFCVSVCSASQSNVTQAQQAPSSKASLEPISIETNTRVLYVDAAQVLEHSKQGEQVRADIQLAYKNSMLSLQQQTQQYQQAVHELEQKMSSLSPTARDAETKKITKMERELKVKKDESEEELRADITKANDVLTKNLLVAAEELAQIHKVDSVVDIKSGTVLWVRESYNYTTQLVQLMDKQYQVKDATLLAKTNVQSNALKSKV